MHGAGPPSSPLAITMIPQQGQIYYTINARSKEELSYWVDGLIRWVSYLKTAAKTKEANKAPSEKPKDEKSKLIEALEARVNARIAARFALRCCFLRARRTLSVVDANSGQSRAEEAERMRDQVRRCIRDSHFPNKDIMSSRILILIIIIIIFARQRNK